jgi:molybdenum-dependent DNA-binding transcriptional regulator ModE
MSTFKRILCALAVFFFFLTSFTFAAGALEKTGTAGAVVQGAKLGSKGLKELTKYGQRLVTDDNKTEEELEQQIKQYSQQQTTKTNQQNTQNKSILDNIASSVSDSADELKTIIIKKTEPVQDVVVGVGQLFSKVKDKVSGSDKESEVTEEQSEVLWNKNKDNNGSGEEEAINQTLLNEMAKSGTKFTSENVIATTRLSDGKIVFMETGKGGVGGSGLTHIIEKHAKDFANIGVNKNEIPKVIMQAINKNKVVGTVGSGSNIRNVYEVSIGNNIQRVAVGIGDNGYIVTAHPY